MHTQTTWSMNMTNPTSSWGESRRYRVVSICAARHSETLSSQLEAGLSTSVQGNPRLMPLSSLLWVFLAFTFSGRDAVKRGCEYSGWKDCTQARGASQGLGEEKKDGEKQESYDSIFCLWILNNSYTILFTASSLFSDFFPHSIWCGPESYSKPARYIQSSGAVSHPELSVWNKLEKLLPFLVQATSQWTDDFPYSSVFRRQQRKKWPLLCKLPESR